MHGYLCDVTKVVGLGAPAAVGLISTAHCYLLWYAYNIL